jgi:misacylated tRNA(Ala) deacylase
MTAELFRDDAYMRITEATVTAVGEDWVTTDQTVFYPVGGGQPGDVGTLMLADGTRLEVVDTHKSADSIRHVLKSAPDPSRVGEPVTLEIDWARRHRLMRMHTCMHLLCAVIDGGVTGGSIRDGSARLDFDLPDTLLDKDDITHKLNELVEADANVGHRWITADELDSSPELVRTMSVQPPRGQGQVRLLEIANIDLQPCGGTHVARTGEVGKVRVKKIEKKGKHNRRVNVVFDD